MEIKPLKDRIVIKRQPAESTTAGGIILPDSGQEQRNCGKVVAVGEGRQLPNGTVVPVDLKKGDVVHYSAYSGTEVQIAGEAYVILREDDVIGVEVKEKKKKAKKA